jgi:hypothetical protein
MMGSEDEHAMLWDISALPLRGREPVFRKTNVLFRRTSGSSVRRLQSRNVISDNTLR